MAFRMLTTRSYLKATPLYYIHENTQRSCTKIFNPQLCYIKWDFNLKRQHSISAHTNYNNTTKWKWPKFKKQLYVVMFIIVGKFFLGEHSQAKTARRVFLDENFCARIPIERKIVDESSWAKMVLDENSWAKMVLDKDSTGENPGRKFHRREWAVAPFNWVNMMNVLSKNCRPLRGTKMGSKKTRSAMIHPSKSHKLEECSLHFNIMSQTNRWMEIWTYEQPWNFLSVCIFDC